MEEKDVLIIGVEHEGKTHKAFTLRPAKVKDTVMSIEENEMAMRNDQYLGVCVLAKQIRIGDIPKEEITSGMLMDMYQVDMALITEANERLKKKIAGFRKEDPTLKETDAGSKEAGVPRL
ncbi:MAG: hypothetical protein K8S18_05010 [Desulfobacula sp.]|nr:hypothetical protein [Desulfobacula sp.]